MDLDRDVKAQFRLRIGLQLSSSMECRALMGRDNDAMLNLPRYHAVYNGNFSEMKDNRVIALSALARNDLWQRLQALKNAILKKNPCLIFRLYRIRKRLNQNPMMIFRIGMI
ncbi:MAG: hypothetical protein KAU26_01435 [Methylococcales bacterium]|nr:hypothetical protein [Methylococcales bacterium]